MVIVPLLIYGYTLLLLMMQIIYNGDYLPCYLGGKVCQLLLGSKVGEHIGSRH